MRDNHDGLPELLNAYKEENDFFGTVAITINGSSS